MKNKSKHLAIGISTTAALALITFATASKTGLRPAWGIHPKSLRPILTPGQLGDSTLLFNGWKITPAGTTFTIGDMPLGGAISPDGTLLAIANCGYGPHALNLISTATCSPIARIPLMRAWNGIAWSPNGGTIYVSGGVANTVNDIYVIRKSDTGEWERTTGLKLAGAVKKQTAIAGLALSPDGTTLYALNNSDNKLYILNVSSGATVAVLPVGDHPIDCKLDQSGTRLYVADLGGAQVTVVNVKDTAAPTVAGAIRTGDHPNAIALAHDGRLFVSCGNSDLVTVADSQTMQPIESIRAALTSHAPAGATPDALCLSPLGDRLYVTNADNNDVAVINTAQRGHSHVLGFIPAGWYPTAVHITPDGLHLLVFNGKGGGSHPNPARTPINPIVPGGYEYIAHQLTGLVQVLPPPSVGALIQMTRTTVANTPYRDVQLTAAASANPGILPTRVGMPCPIRYVLYIIKENRTYDQVFGDEARGNGNTNYTLFGRDVTPNHHDLAEQFVLLDNLYCNGEVSADGHPWCTSAIATDFVQRSWVLSYSGKGQAHESPQVMDPTLGYIWDSCKRAGISYRDYGEYVGGATPKAPPTGDREEVNALRDHANSAFDGTGRKGAAPMRDTDRATVFSNEFSQMVKCHTVPRFMVMHLGDDHTHGTKVGEYTPKSSVACNDEALGSIVETISKSPLWKQFAIFVIEDDAQNGPDHVDSHRTCGLVVSPWVHKHSVDSTFYTTVSMLRTMELILGLKPMTQYDAAATPMFASFGMAADERVWNALPARISISDRNTSTAFGAQASARMDFSDYDRAPEQELNSVLWHSIKGAGVPMPAPVRSAVVP